MGGVIYFNDMPFSAKLLASVPVDHSSVMKSQSLVKDACRKSVGAPCKGLGSTSACHTCNRGLASLVEEEQSITPPVKKAYT
jgi:hypothetical protein